MGTAGTSESHARDRRLVVLFAVTCLMLLVGVGMHLLGAEVAASVSWVGGTVIGLLAALRWAWAAVAEHRPSVDVIAILALIGSLVVAEPLAGSVIAVMLATGQWLEARSQARAERNLQALIDRRPTQARRRNGTQVEVLPVSEVRIGDVILVATGELVPVDGRLRTDAVLDESALTGEPLPVARAAGELIRSGSVNAGSACEFAATATDADSSYSMIVSLVRQAQSAAAPVVRTADRFAVIFVPLTLILAALAWWLSADPVRAVAVLVVATPCPLILGAPIALISGMSQAAKRGVIIKGGGALERLAAAKVLLIDKTGTLTVGKPVLSRIAVAPGVDSDAALRLAASLEQLSPHVVASSLVMAARQRQLDLVAPNDVTEELGSGIRGEVEGTSIWLGDVGRHDGAIPAWARRARTHASLDGALAVLLDIDGEPAALFVFDDPIRLDAARMIRRLRRVGVTRTVLVSGDRPEVAELVGAMVGVDEVVSGTDPAGKAAVVVKEAKYGPTMMVGDGVNDAPALATASVGIALAARGTSASSEAASVVLMVESLDALAESIRIANRARRFAFTSASVGMGLSAVAMVVAALGYLPPVIGALLQEGIDVLAILIALGSAVPVASRRRQLPTLDRELVERLRSEHDGLKGIAEQVRTMADSLSLESDLEPLRLLVDRLECEQLPHERAEEHQLYPAAARVLGGDDPMAALSRAHGELERQVRQLRTLSQEIEDELTIEDLVELRRILYGLYAVLRLHNAQEEEIVFSLGPSS